MTKLHRRQVFRGMVAGSSALASLRMAALPAVLAQEAGSATAESFTAEVGTGLDVFRRLAEEQIGLFEALLAAVETGDAAAAKAAYVAARPPYEEIEVLAASFPETDAAIDARPYAIDGGETSPDYVSIHRVEALLYRDDDLTAALPFARGLVASGRRLRADLDQRDAFSATQSFAGMIGLADEIASKKISSEEETWSDQSLLIFAHNWRGIQSQYDPFAPAVAAADATVAEEVAAAIEAAQATLAGYSPAADGAYPPYSAVPMRERGAIVEASYRLRDALAAAQVALGLA